MSQQLYWIVTQAADVALKPRRDALRKQTDLRWRKKLGYVPTHRPMFGNLPEHRHERWRLVKEFLEIWHRPPKPKDGFTEKRLDQAERAG